MSDGNREFLQYIEYCRLVAEGKLNEEHKLSNRIIASIMNSGGGNLVWEDSEEILTWMNVVSFMEAYIEELEAEVSKSQYTEGLKALRERVARKMEEREKEAELVLIPCDKDW